MQSRWAVAGIGAAIAAAWLGAPAARAQAFNPGRCSGLICGFGSDAGQPSAAKPPPNCGGLLCDTGAARAFEPAPVAPPPAAQTADADSQAAATTLRSKHKPRHKRIGARGAKDASKTAPPTTGSTDTPSK